MENTAMLFSTASVQLQPSVDRTWNYFENANIGVWCVYRNPSMMANVNLYREWRDEAGSS